MLLGWCFFHLFSCSIVCLCILCLCSFKSLHARVFISVVSQVPHALFMFTNQCGFSWTCAFINLLVSKLTVFTFWRVYFPGFSFFVFCILDPDYTSLCFSLVALRVISCSVILSLQLFSVSHVSLVTIFVTSITISHHPSLLWVFLFTILSIFHRVTILTAVISRTSFTASPYLVCGNAPSSLLCISTIAVTMS